jgi:hypothetical protein
MYWIRQFRTGCLWGLKLMWWLIQVVCEVWNWCDDWYRLFVRVAFGLKLLGVHPHFWRKPTCKTPPYCSQGDSGTQSFDCQLWTCNLNTTLCQKAVWRCEPQSSRVNSQS